MPDPIINRVYSLQIQGYDDSLTKVKALTAEFQKMDAAKTKLNAKLQNKLNSGDTATIQQLTDKIKELQKQMDQLSIKKNALNSEAAATSSGTEKEISAYQNLIKQYKEAKTSAQEMAAQFGVESEQAKTAAISLSQYKDQLTEINALVKTGGVATAANVPVTPEPTLPTNIPYSVHTDQLAEQRAELERTGVVVNELDQAQLDAQLSAQEWANSQKIVTEEVKQTGNTVQEIKGSYDEYTGTLRQNISVQIENAQALAANKEEQKQIVTEMKAHGGATQEQTTRLAELREQALILTETNKQLTTTVRNQAQEFIAGTGSMDEMQAKINQLQQAYEQLNEAERASPFGQGIKAEIDILEPKIKELEGTIGRFQRNVGNYPTAFTAPFKTLNDEIDRLQAKVVSGNFSGSVDQLTAKQNALAKANALVNKEFSSSTSQANAFKQAATEIGLAYGSNSEFATKFTSEVKSSNTAVTAVSDTFKKTAESGRGFIGIFQNLYSGLRKLAYLIPGLGMSGIILLLLGPLQAAGAAIVRSVQKGMESIGALSEEAKKKIEELAKATKAVNEEYIKGSTASILKLELLRDVITDTTRSMKERVSALHDYNKVADTANKLDVNQINNLNLINDSISRQITLIQQRALATASEKIVADRAEKLLLAQETAREKAIKEQEVEDAYNIQTVEGAKTDEYFKTLQREGSIREKISKDAAVKQAQAEFDAAKQIARTNLDKTGFVGDKEDPSKKTDNKKGSRIDLQDREQIKLIEANRARLLAIENTGVNEIQKVRELSFAEEKAHLLKVEQINVDALNKKIQLLSEKKKLNAEEKKQLAEFAEQRSSIELDTSKKVNDLLQKDFDERARKFKENLDRQIENAKAANKQIQDNVDADPSTKAQAQLDADDAILKAQVAFFFQMDFLEKAYNKVSKKNAEDRARDAKATNDAVNKDRKAVSVSVLSDIEKETNEDVVRIKLKYDKLVAQILASRKSAADKTVAIKILSNTQDVETGGVQLKSDVSKLIAAKQLLDFGLITKKQFEEIYNAAVEGQKKLNTAIETGKKSISSFGDLLNNSLSKLFGFADGSDKAKLLGQTLAGSFDTAKSAMDSYFQAETANIQHSNDVTQQKLDIELQQAKSRAQSQAETDSLERQFATKKDAENRKAFEKNKKLQIEQAKINLAIQLSNLAVIAFAPNPLNIATLGIAGAVMYAVQAALAFVNYASNVSKINSAKYAGGGLVKPVKIKNGRIDNPSNIPTQPNGDDIYATVKRGEVILNEEQQRKLGGHATFRSIGVPGFATGGKIDYSSPFLGINRLNNWNSPAPIDPGAYLNGGRNDQKTETQLNKLIYEMDKTRAMIAETSRQTNQRIDKIKVQVVAKEVDDSNTETKKAVRVGRL